MKRNIEKINQLADRIEKCEEVEDHNYVQGMGPSFTMSEVAYPCGSPACIMGHAQAMRHRSAHTANATLLGRFLGILKAQANELAAPEHKYAEYLATEGDEGFIAKQHAVAVLRNLAATGEVNWKIGEST